MKMFYVYILYSRKLDKYYKGQTNNLAQRIVRHNWGYERFTKSGVPWEFVMAIEKSTLSEAVVLEKKLKNVLARHEQGFFIEGLTEDIRSSVAIPVFFNISLSEMR